MSKRTTLYEKHLVAGGHLVDFAGWEMPLHYGSQIEEHHCIRKAVGMFDVSHMGVVDVHGSKANDFLRYILANDIAKLKSPGKAFYSCMLNEKGGVIDDLIVYYVAEDQYRIVVNAGTRDTDITWLKSLAKQYDVQVTERSELAIIALQGPESLHLLATMLSEPLSQQLTALKPFEFFSEEDVMIARTGYTGEEGVEIIVSKDLAPGLWQDLLNEQVRPCGLGARDTLRLEAGFNLYGSDMNENTSPWISNLGWTVSLKDETRDFVGRAALEKEKTEGIKQKLVGLVMKEPGVLRDHQKVFVENVGEGEITSGSFSPTLNHAIALARVPIDTKGIAEIERRGKRIKVEIVQPPFVKR